MARIIVKIQISLLEPLQCRDARYANAIVV